MWLIFLSWCIGAALAMSLVFCICWRKKPPNDDWQGLDGMVTQKNPDENVNHLPSATTCMIDGVSAAGDSVDAKRNTISNPRRSLPDIPSEQSNGVNWDPTGDNSSELYATVGQYQNQNSAKRHTIANGLEARPSISQHSSISQADDAFSPYERVNYDKIQSKEHPYAQLQPTTSRITTAEEHHTSQEGLSLLRSELQPGNPSIVEPTAPSRSRRSSSHSGGSVMPDVIPAASAVAGVLAASPELPYMTPPVPQQQQQPQLQQQGNFSGDSQDSSKGYTSISVREPLANIMAQTKQISLRKREIDPHYSTVSDDSDDVYTTIPDSSGDAVVNRIPLTVEAEINAPPSTSVATSGEYDDDGDDDEAIDELYEPPPCNRQPPPGGGGTAGAAAAQPGNTSQHSRQASSSSSVTILGSPKPEKRQANSPYHPRRQLVALISKQPLITNHK
nr:unnamed protein product [Callosobruchus analis]